MLCPLKSLYITYGKAHIDIHIDIANKSQLQKVRQRKNVTEHFRSINLFALMQCFISKSKTYALAPTHRDIYSSRLLWCFGAGEMFAFCIKQWNRVTLYLWCTKNTLSAAMSRLKNHDPVTQDNPDIVVSRVISGSPRKQSQCIHRTV